MREIKPLKPFEWIELVFDGAYLAFALVAGVLMLALAGGGNVPLRLYGMLALTLGCGDAFHLLPRMYGIWRGKMDTLTKVLGFGKLVTSVTMTAFYLILYHVFLLYYGISAAGTTTLVLYGLAAVRIVFTLLPQNRWFQKEAPLKWAIYRNAPFLVMGIILIALFEVMAVAGSPFRLMPLAIGLSFGCYVPVVLLADRFPPVGALMLPKTMAYIWMICMGFGLI